ncbi:hypothetical protein NDN08_001053 [Rhodosorus marinus]|uniref:Mitochondrial import inner membrane translocase subunit n=1 Tax=Rhodosorus marinus TaxID=101924 RepID=A0AAV8UPP6_9RHOD|nr:hypothetical protein NDN08_001053 [Rhodosorus marinus]
MAGFGMAGFPAGGGGTQAEQQMMQMMHEMQVQDSLRMYNELVHRCFGDCVDGFRSKKLDGKEEACVTKCADKFIKTAARAGMRFAEEQQAMLQDAQNAGVAGSLPKMPGR